jgi:hypothetical protein
MAMKFSTVLLMRCCSLPRSLRPFLAQLYATGQDNKRYWKQSNQETPDEKPADRFERSGKASMIFPLLRYLGRISKPEFSEYGFRIENEDRSVRLLILTIADSVFLTKQLMVQEAPDLCYQKVLTELKNESSDQATELILVTGLDIEAYRAFHPFFRRKSYTRPSL